MLQKIIYLSYWEHGSYKNISKSRKKLSGRWKIGGHTFEPEQLAKSCRQKRFKFQQQFSIRQNINLSRVFNSVLIALL